MSDTDSLDVLFATLKSADEETKRLTRLIEGVRETHAKALTGIKDRLKAGETTSDCLQDFLIVVYGDPDPKCEQAYRDLDLRVRAHQGEFVLVIQRSEEPTVHGGPDYVLQPHEYCLEETYWLGVLRGPLQLDLIVGDWRFATGPHVKAWGSRKIECRTESADLKLWFPRHFFVQLERVAVRHGNDWMYDLTGEPPPELSIFVGDAEIEAWLKPNRHEERAFQFSEEPIRLTSRAQTFLKMVQAGGWNELVGGLPFLDEEMLHRADVIRRAIEVFDTKRRQLLTDLQQPQWHQHAEKIHAELQEARNELVTWLKEAKELNCLDETGEALWQELKIS